MNRNKQIRWIAYLLVLACVTLCLYAARDSEAAVGEAAGPAGPPQTHEGETGNAPTLDDQFAEVARRVPAFGGMFIGRDKLLYVYLVDLAQKAAAEAAILEIFGRERVPQGGIYAVQGQYGFLQLKDWHDRQRVATLAIPGVLMTSIAESKNRLQIGVNDAGVIPQVDAELFNLGIPRAAVDVVVARPFKFRQTLQDTQRPLKGGLQISHPIPPTDIGICTLGFLAVRQGQAGFVTNSHCTSIQGGVENTIFHQAVPSGVTNRVGVETVDPQFTSTPSCPSGRKCRKSDSAFIRRDSGTSQATAPASAELGYIASTNYNSITINHKFHITGEVNAPIEGEVLSKVGSQTGLTEGEVCDTCVDMNPLGTNITLLCQDVLEAKNKDGDSGSPVFSWSSATLPPGGIPPAKLYGIQWGGSGEDLLSFSAMGNLQGNAELGPLKSFLEEAGANSPPEIKIMKPTSGTSVGIGGFNGVKFEAKVVDYEGCCTEVTWQSNLDGVMGQGTSIEYTFKSPGTRTVIVTAKDNNGATDFHSIAVTATNTAPTVTIDKPTSGQTLYVGTTYVFVGDSSDMNEQFFKLPCSALKWTSSKAGDPFPKWGCTPQVAFPTTGWRTITLTGTDSEGATDTDTVMINVVNPPANGPPVVTILNPLNNYFLDPYVYITLSGTANDPDNKSPLTYTWKIKNGTTWTTLFTGTMNDEQTIIKLWKPANNVPFSCGGGTVRLYLFATDADGLQGWDFVDIYIGYPVC